MSKATLAELLAAEREAMVRGETSASRSLAGLQAAIAEGREAIVDVPPAAVGGNAIAKLGIVAGVLAIAVAVGILASERDEPTTAARGEVYDSEPPRPPNEPGPELQADPKPDPATRSLASPSRSEPPAPRASGNRRGERVSRPRAKPPVEVEPSDERDSAFAAELKLLREAKRSADAGQSRAALQLLQTQASRFPSGFFVEERRALQVRVLCDLGRIDDARAAKQRFLRDFPASPQTERVRSACD